MNAFLDNEAVSDRLWVDEATSWLCVVRWSETGVLCGYVGIPESHPLFGIHYLDEDFKGIDVHGGVTFTDHWDDDKATWWIGFDYGHYGDTPDEEIAIKEVEKFAKQLSKISS